MAGTSPAMTSEQLSPLVRTAIYGARIERLLRVAELERDRAAAFRAERHRAVEAGSAPGVTGALTRLLDLDQDHVLIAVDPHLDDALGVAGGFPLAPQHFPRAAEVPGFAGRNGLDQRLRVHVGEHQHFAGRR